MSYKDRILIGQNKILDGHHQKQSLNFIYICCCKMIYDKKIVRTSRPTTIAIPSDMNNDE